MKPTKPANVNSKDAISIEPATCPSLPPELEDEEELELLEEELELELLDEELEELELDEEPLVDLRTRIELSVAL